MGTSMRTAALLLAHAALAAGVSVAVRPRVTVVGAGVSGLCCARTLHAAGVDVSVIERADGVGGRVRSDIVDGFILDRGFQVFLTEYPEPRSVLDLDALDLRPFLPGALVQLGAERHLVADPFRRPQDLLRGALAPVGSLVDKARVALFAVLQFLQPVDAIFAKPPRSTLAFLRAELAVSDVMIERFFRPFYQGIFLAPLDEQDARMFEFVFKMFTLGVAALPAKGLGEVPKQLARALPEDTVRTRTLVLGVSATSVRVAEVGAEKAEGAREPDDHTLESDAVVLAVDRPALAAIDGAHGAAGTDGERSSTAIYFAIDGPPPIAEPILVLNGECGRVAPGASSAVLNNVCFPSSVASSYAPAGKALASCTVVGDPAVTDAELERAVREQLGRWFGAERVAAWRHLRTYRVRYAQPTQLGARGGFDWPARLDGGLYRCGDHTSSPTLNGAMASGRRAAEAVLEDLRARGRLAASGRA
ncbi:hypothetical protein KFE25_003904 [Diacronema lutheri]|uniref:Amine oxidase domain-containing protein n=1 Tax=Diacronema lutheri TaxID=2081491 RepID=A0A8J5X8K5_DIALT|nr:hypothetical protein KFE25_003904 [Diacronema lutheri]